MLKAINTTNMAGIRTIGDFNDFEQLYEAIHQILPEEGEDMEVEDSRLRVLGFCYDLRHALMGDRDYEYVDNGLNDDIIQQLGIVGPKKNLYLAFPTFYPEMIFVTFALNYFISEYEAKRKKTTWDSCPGIARNFQNAVLACLKETLTPQKFINSIRLLNSNPSILKNYRTQYLDFLNLRFLEWDPTKREQNISILVKRIIEKGTEYQQIERKIMQAAYKYQCLPSEIELNEEYPEHIDW
ncbi:hypothetical protein NST11_17095 [Caldifermentibacillus hisashii]|uniref:DUF6904 family protein n=1 Tax=Caldifermentibacillus hisashii TaxID=996558 RepID=UPI0031B777AF